MCINYTLYFIYYRSRNISFIKIISLIKFILVPDTHVKNYVFFYKKHIVQLILFIEQVNVALLNVHSASTLHQFANNKLNLTIL